MVIQFFLEIDIKVHHTGNKIHVFFFPDHGDSPLHLAGQGGSAEAFNCLLQHNARLDVVNLRGDSPTDTAKRHGHPLLMQKASKL